MRPSLPVLALCIATTPSCTPREEMPDAFVVEDEDTGASVDDARAEPDAGPPLTPWPDGLASIGAMTRRDFHLARAIVHAHSPLSHDACDGEGWVDGELADTECLEHLRDAVCRLHLDTLWLTDHAPHVEEPSFEAAHWPLGESDDVVRDEEGHAIAAHWGCDDGHRVLVMVGSENEMMPVGLRRPPTEDPAVLADPARLGALYDADGPEAAAAFRAAGAIVLYAHTEGHSLEQIRSSAPDGIEIYNTHANVDPNIREELLGLGRLDYAAMLLRFTNAASRMEPDLALLSFLSENRVALNRWDTLLAEGMHLVGTGGCDAHENTFTTLMPDGERGDSYRRMMYWHTHHLLVRGEGRDAMMEALGHGRLFLTFEVFGTPVGFDFVGTNGSVVCEMGDDCAVGATLRVTRPSLPEGFPSEPTPSIRLRILRAAAGGAIEVASGTGETLEHVTTEAGVYRAEVLIVPEHARPYLARSADELVREVPWVYANPIYVID
ncbi:MAG: hypothetical protein J0L92_04825 [Deltaproteobacteria bacterium]|nr:hypothetical protein [Deltaproteobacteria bacterium]